MTTAMTCVAVVQLESSTIYGVGADEAQARQDAQAWTDDLHGLVCVPCSAGAAAFVRENGGARSAFLAVEPGAIRLAAELYAAEINDAIEGHLRATEQAIDADSHPDVIMGEDSWQAPADVPLPCRVFWQLVRDEIERRIAAA